MYAIRSYYGQGMNEDNIVEKVCLLAVFKKEQGETLEDVQAMLVETGMFDT